MAGVAVATKQQFWLLCSRHVAAAAIAAVMMPLLLLPLLL
jgi:hypothetical protein